MGLYVNYCVVIGVGERVKSSETERRKPGCHLPCPAVP